MAAVGVPPGEPAAVVVGNRVVAATPAARAAGVRVGHRRREAQGRCPELAVHERDESREARAFEPVVQAVEAFTPRLELTRPGVVTFATRGPSRYFGGDRALARRVLARAEQALAPTGWAAAVHVGVADGPFAAARAARDDGRLPGGDLLPAAVSGLIQEGRATIVPVGATPAFLAARSIHVLDRPELTAVLARLGLTTLGAFAALDAAHVVARFGSEGAEAHRLARGLDARPPRAVEPPPDLVLTAELDPPAERVDAAAFVAKALADELFAALDARGLSCTRILVGAETEHGEVIERLWRHEGVLSAGAVTDRVRWQLDGWLHAPAGGPAPRPTAGITFLRLAPDEVVPAHGRQLGFWGGETEADRRALRAVARVQGLLGPDAVLVAEWRGGRAPAEQLALVPTAAVELTGSRPMARPDWVRAPWPGRLPSPAPAVVLPTPVPAEVVDEDGRPVAVNGRGLMSATPARVAVGAQEWRAVTAWTGPWPVDERWWDGAARRRRARFQVVTDEGTARLLSLEGGRWWVEAVYD